jgi:YD repeat-containing protein
VTYGYNGSGQLTTLTRGAGTTDALTATFGYSGTQLISVTTPYTQATRTWTLGYDGSGRLVSITSPVSGTLGQAGYTPAYTTLLSYNGGTTQVVDGAGTSGALTTTDTLDGAGEATQVTDGLGNTGSATYDADHDVLTSTDANGNTTTNSYQYVGPNGSTGLITQTVQPKIQAYSPLNGTLDSPTTRHTYNASNDLIETDLPEGGTELFGYDTHHGVITTTQTTANATTWRGSVNQLDAFGDLTGVVDGASMVARLTTAQQRRLYAALLQPRALLAYALLQVNPRAAHAFAGDAEMDARFDVVYNLTEPALHCQDAPSAPEIHSLGSYAHQYRQSATRQAYADYRPALAEQHTLDVVIKGSCDFRSTKLSSYSHR